MHAFKDIVSPYRLDMLSQCPNACQCRLTERALFVVQCLALVQAGHLCLVLPHSVVKLFAAH